MQGCALARIMLRYSHMKELTASQIGRLGALATNRKLSAEQRKKNARKASKARWKKHRSLIETSK